MGTTLVNDGAWHHLAGVFNDQGNSLRVYVDGRLEGNTTTATKSPANSVSPLLIGGPDQWTGGYLRGLIDEVRFDKVGYSDEEVLDLYSLEVEPTDTEQVIATALAGSTIGTYVREPIEATSASGKVFVMPVNTYPGDSYTIELILSNAASIDMVRRLTVSAPPCFSFSSLTPFDETQNVRAFQAGAGTFRVHVSPDASGVAATDTLRLAVRVGSSVKPGFYGVKVAMEPYTSN